MERFIVIDNEIVNAAEKTTGEALTAAAAAVKDGSPEDIKKAVADYIAKSQTYRAILCARYHL